MREIKFRAWDKESNVMIYSDSVYPRSSYKLEFDILNDMEFTLTKMIDRVNVYYEDGEETYIEIFNKVDAELMQYTGLKDKNGKEIYEGDIVQTCENYKQVVVWHNNGYKLKFTFSGVYRGDRYTETKYLELGDTSSRRWGDEVLGNIYENPELLK